MLTMADLIAVLSLCLTSFGLGYTIGCNNKTATKDSLDLACLAKKITACQPEKLIRLFFIYNDQVNRHWQYLLYKYINIVLCVCQIYVV